MKILKTIYKIVRGVLFTAIILVAVVYLLLYIAISVPYFQNKLTEKVENELKVFLGTRVDIESMDIRPFNEVVINGLSVYDKDESRCLYVETVGAGIRLWRLVNDGKIELSYAEIIGLNAKIYQSEEGKPLNIQFIIDAFKPKEEGKPPTQFDLNLKNVVLRRCSASFDRLWQPVDNDKLKTDFNHLYMSDLRADLNLPRLSNDDIRVDLRRLSFRLSGGLDVQSISFKGFITPRSISVKDLEIKLPSTEILPGDLNLRFNSFKDIKNALTFGNHYVSIKDSRITPSDFSWLAPVLHRYQMTFAFNCEAEGNLETAKLKSLKFNSENSDFDLSLSAEADHLSDKQQLDVILSELYIKASKNMMDEIVRLLPGISGKVADYIALCGNVEMSATGKARPGTGYYQAELNVDTDAGSLEIDGNVSSLSDAGGIFDGYVAIDSVNLGDFLGDARFGKLSADVTLSGRKRYRELNGKVEADIRSFEYEGMAYDGIVGSVSKDGEKMMASLIVDNDIANANIHADGMLKGENSWAIVSARIESFTPSRIGLLPKFKGYNISTLLNARVAGNNADNIVGEVLMNDASLTSPDGRKLKLDRFDLRADKDSIRRSITLRSDWIDGNIEGDFRFRELPLEIKEMLSMALPGIIETPAEDSGLDSDVEFSFMVKQNASLYDFFNLPVRPLVDFPIKGAIDGTGNTSNLSIDIPFLQQGKNKLVRDSRIDVSMDGDNGTVSMDVSTVYPAKKGEVALSMNLLGKDDNILSDIEWNTLSNSSFNGKVSLGAVISKDELTNKPELRLDINPSSFDFGSAHWNIDRSSVVYDDGIIDVNGLRIWHDGQFVEIDGRASALAADSLSVRLAEIDLGYVFDTLNINYVSFGGTATGDVTAWGAFSKEPRALTDNLDVKGLSYNGTVLGDAILKSHWDNREKKVAISADIMGKDNNLTKMDGGIWVTRDSLSFEIDANRVPVGFLGPFMSAFTSDVSGFASGKAKLFGTFSDIDLVGRVFADSIAIKLDYTNVYYHGTDSVILNPGRIEIPSFRLYDKYGNSGILSGELTHRYFHDPRFMFRISDVRHLLCYDTNPKMNPDWYGTFYGNGSAVVRGWPGTVSVSVDMTAVGNSNFTFVLNDRQAAEDYHFLTFSDRRKEAAAKLHADTVSSIIESFRKKIDAGNDMPSKFMIDIRGSVTPSTLMTLVMDPVAGDKITARGNGNIQVDYDSESDAMQMFGKYILEEGNYNFSLQDLILRDFKIREGSSIAFNGDPLNAQLDITASYRVNTNLTDLDKNFSNDRELARTNVPVDALLMVAGEMQHPDITFDIELPTLTQDVERKVKSIISTDDMMSRQIIYLLALNRFYTPEYMGSTSNGGELAAVASSTLSSQLSNMLGQLTDKFTVAPSFRSDKGDFSDLEVDVALSSRLLNNRLLINGNFGYRDRSTSSTTFVGDFDIEYLLSRNGNLRLKAYNHFNDQNYYLRQALTTQGLGVVYRKDFDNLFSFLRKKRGKKDGHNDLEENSKDDKASSEEVITEETEEITGEGKSDEEE